MRRIGQVIGLRAEVVEDYDRIHREVWPGVLDIMRKHNIRNYSIFRDGTRLFSHMEYVGTDYEADMAAIGSDPVNQKWWEITGPMQVADEDRAEGDWWKTIPEVFHTD